MERGGVSYIAYVTWLTRSAQRDFEGDRSLDIGAAAFYVYKTNQTESFQRTRKPFAERSLGKNRRACI